jgi:DNA-binding transcriptional LysR family regulator
MGSDCAGRSRQKIKDTCRQNGFSGGIFSPNFSINTDQAMELRHLRYFVMVAEERHYGRAAQRLYVSQPTLSQQIVDLENEIGVELFARKKRKLERQVVLTEAGKVFWQEAKRILDLSQRAIEQTRRIGLGEHAQVMRVGTYKMALRERISEMIQWLKKTFPSIEIKLTELPNSQAVEEALAEERLDLGLILLPQKHPELTSKILKQGYLCLMMPSQHPMATMEVIALDTLKDERWVELHRQVHPFIEEIEQACRQAGLHRKGHIAEEVSSLEMLSTLVGMGSGVAFVSSLYDLRHESNVVVRPVAPQARQLQQRIEIHNALAYKTDRNTPLIQALIGSLQN